MSPGTAPGIKETTTNVFGSNPTIRILTQEEVDKYMGLDSNSVLIGSDSIRTVVDCKDARRIYEQTATGFSKIEIPNVKTEKGLLKACVEEIEKKMEENTPRATFGQEYIGGVHDGLVMACGIIERVLKENAKT